ncbi:MBL fold metallo-hydrolase [Natrarchaeobius halalkaliphilus]|uniref:MBL fold metallo-hydrolase n=1 Tax=Natrarchaeobius halalkaliphilus TaxID=1679091 RepID=A0A3N6LP16_9EURY|nr:MBL fold metallo-hydrolase [Natrarchaeobius halalkaliphilus]RQG89807.1 MBL fold metallo-hydrolase [Natrarchaeobius halalkaliphilus]
MTEIRSDWGDWLIRDVEAAQPNGLAVWYLGCNGFILKGSDGTTVFIDPYVGLGDPPRTVRMIPVPFDPDDVTDADAVLATHEHTDHVHGPTQAPILERTGATLYAPDESLSVVREDEEWLTEWNVDEGQLSEVTEGKTVEIGEFTVHVEHANDSDASHPVSYVIEHDAGTFFHGGDTKPSDEFERIGREYDIDLGVLAFGTVGMVLDRRTRWYNDENQIIEAATALEIDRLLPSHWDMWRGLTSDPKTLHHHAKSFEYPSRLEITEIGDRVDITGA